MNRESCIVYRVEPRTPNPEPRTTNPEPRTTNPEPRTTNHEPRTTIHGFTLIEVMVATAVLALGMLFIYQGFLNSLDVFDYYANYLDLAPLANEKIWQAQDELRGLGPQAKIETRGEFLKGAKPVDWDLSYNLIDAESGLYKIDLAFSWKSAARRARLLRSAYALFDETK